MQKVILLAVFSLFMFSPAFASAQGLKDASGFLDKAASTEKTGLSSNLADTVAAVIKAILALVGTVFLVLTIYAGIMWMTAQGAEDRVTKAQDIIKASVIGLIIIMSAYAITYFVTKKLGGSGISTGTTLPSQGACATDADCSSLSCAVGEDPICTGVGPSGEKGCVCF